MYKDNLLISNNEDEKRNHDLNDHMQKAAIDQYQNFNHLQVDTVLPPGLGSTTNSNIGNHNLTHQQAFHHQPSHTQDIRMIKEANGQSKISMVKNQTFTRAGLDLTVNSTTSTGACFQYQQSSLDSNGQNIIHKEKQTEYLKSDRNNSSMYQQHVAAIQSTKNQNKENFDYNNMQNNTSQGVRGNNSGQGNTKIESIKPIFSSSNGFKTINSVQVNQAQPSQNSNITPNLSQNIQMNNNQSMFKNHKSFGKSQTSTSINMPRGTNQPQRSFNREVDSKIGPAKDQISMPTSNKFQIHPSLNVPQGQSVLPYQAQNYQKQSNANTSMMIVENQDEQKLTSSQLHDRYKVVNYDYNSSNNLHYKNQRNQSLLSGINYPKKSNYHNMGRMSGDESTNVCAPNTSGSQGEVVSNLGSQITSNVPSFGQKRELMNVSSSCLGSNSVNSYAPQIIGNTTKSTFRGQTGNRPSLAAAMLHPDNSNSSKYNKNSSVTSKMSGIERVGHVGSNSQGAVSKSGNESSNYKQINIMNIKQNGISNSQCMKSLNDSKGMKVVSQQRNFMMTQCNTANLNSQPSQGEVTANFDTMKLASQVCQTGVTPTLENIINENQCSSQEMPKLQGTGQPLNKLQNRSIIGHRYSNAGTQNFNAAVQSISQNQNQRMNSQNANAVQKTQNLDRSQTNRGNKGALLASERYKMNSSQQTAGSSVTRYMSNLHQQQMPASTVPPINNNCNPQSQATAQNALKRRNGSNIPINIRTKSQNSSGTQSGIKEICVEQRKKRTIGNQSRDERERNQMEKWKKENERKKAERFEDKLKSVHDDFKDRCRQHLQNTVEDCDKQDAHNVQYVAEFTKDIMKHFIRTEMNNQPKNKYMEMQPQITERMRSILIDWIIEVHFQFKLKPESLFLTINMIDRYLELAMVTKEKLQLVGVSAMLIACKYEEIWPPLIKDYIHMCDNAYDKDQIINMELDMLAQLDFNVDFVSSNIFLDRFVQITKADKMTHHLAQYMIEISMLDYSSILLQPSYLALSALYLAKKIMNNPHPWNKKLSQVTGYSEKYVVTLSQILLKLLKSYQKPNNNHLVGLKKKFATDQYSNISTYFQFDYNSQKKENGSSNVKSDIDSTVACGTTDKKRNISGDKLNVMTGQKTINSTDASTNKKGAFQFNQHKAVQQVSAFEQREKNQNSVCNKSGTVSTRAYQGQNQSSEQSLMPNDSENTNSQSQSQVPHLPQIVPGTAKQYQSVASNRSVPQQQQQQYFQNSMQNQMGIQQNMLQNIPHHYQEQIVQFLQCQQVHQQNLLNQHMQQQQYDLSQEGSHNSHYSQASLQQVQADIQNYQAQELQEYLRQLNENSIQNNNDLGTQSARSNANANQNGITNSDIKNASNQSNGSDHYSSQIYSQNTQDQQMD